MRCAVVGAGAWGTALGDLLSRNGYDTTLWAHEPDVVVSINQGHENRRFLSGLPVSESLRATIRHDEALRVVQLRNSAQPFQRLSPRGFGVGERLRSSDEPGHHAHSVVKA